MKMESPFKADIMKGKGGFVDRRRIPESGLKFLFNWANMAPPLPSWVGAKVFWTPLFQLSTLLASLYCSFPLLVKDLDFRAIGLEGDVRKRDDAVRVIESTVKHFGRLDILVNAAAGNFLVPAEDLSPNGFRTVIDIDSVGTFTMCHEALKVS
ncbi:hypothetical protein Pint_12135 [Pistacia integerrima]|uniref:Uncharacterized protein n=1 Tax=Pistacia integerrima TaxID=434235 RepID=A0ACC0XHH1_9ROSI|nr:hypothetical protein Pint_12135 [Pistacia integerrima]